ncbi:hypothetical protein AX15_001301 [Amanita polypyramis BW_CC]|nr:hypothetical protein AX15_001301 [Amanita polypyramis BW_CC]
MSFSQSARGQIKIAQKSWPRHVSTAQKSSPSSAGAVVPAKMRALVSLYHQADTFITPKNLSQRIDEAFVPSLGEDGGQTYGPVFTQRRHLVKLKDLKELLETQRNGPKVTEPDREQKMPSMDEYRDVSTWSGQKKKRERKVVEALYGVEGGRGGQMLPGLEVLLEEQERLEKDMKVDEEDRGWLEEC